MATIVTRSGKGSPLTNNEVDANFNNLNSGKAELSGATFTGAITANAGVVVDNFTLNGTTLALSSGDMTLDSAGDIILDADGGDVRLKDGGAEFGLLKKDSTRFTIEGPDNPVRIATGTSNIQVNHDTHITFDTANVERFRIAADGFGDYVSSANDIIRFGGANSGSITFRNDTSNQFVMHTGTSDDFVIGTGGNNDRLTITAAGAATFSSSVTATSLDISGDIDVDGVTNLDVVDIDGAVDMASTLAVGGVVTANAGVRVDNFTLDGATLALSSGDFTLDVAGEIELDADGGKWLFKDGGVQIGRIENTSNNFVIKSSVNNASMIFNGEDGDNNITALTLDMSAAGASTFNSTVKVGGTVLATGAALVNSTSAGGFGFASNNTAFYSFGANTSTAGSYTFQNLSSNASVNVTSLSIASTGISVTGNVDINGGYLDIGPSSGNIGKIGFDSNNVYIGSSSGTGQIIFKNNISSTGAPHSTGDTKMVITDAEITMANTLTVASTITGQKLVATNGIVELDDNGSHNGIINSPASLFINIDSDASNTGEVFVITKDRTGTSGGTELFRIKEDGKVGIGTNNPTRPLQIQLAENQASTFQTNFDIKRGWTSGVSTDRYTGMSFSDFNSINAGIYANRHSSHANFESDLCFYTNSGSSNVDPSVSLTKKMSIMANGNVGIGVPSPTYKIDATTTSGGNGLKMARGAGSFFEQFQSTTGGVSLAASGSGAYMSIRTGTTAGTTTERMRIDSSGNVLVGTTTPVFTNSILQATSSTGPTIGARQTTAAQYAGGFWNNANGSTNLLAFFSGSSGSQVGSIGSVSGKLQIDGPANNSGLRFHTNSLIPQKNKDVVDAQVDLGLSSHRFRELFLSGGVHLGGTGAANKLDDYEEGAWTPTFVAMGNGTYTTHIGRYTKIGNIVTANFHIDINALGTASGNLKIAGLPFTSVSTANNYGSTTTTHASGWTADYANLGGLVNPNTAFFFVYYQNTSGNMVAATHAQMQVGNFLGTIIYEAA